MKRKYHLKSKLFFALCFFPLYLFAQSPQDACQINLNFDYAVEDLEVSFHNSSTGYDSVFWEFGDGTSSHKINPTHHYEKTNAYKFCLTLTDSTRQKCQKKFCGQVYIFDPCE